jgi:hypothetical protein
MRCSARAHEACRCRRARRESTWSAARQTLGGRSSTSTTTTCGAATHPRARRRTLRIADTPGHGDRTSLHPATARNNRPSAMETTADHLLSPPGRRAPLLRRDRRDHDRGGHEVHPEPEERKGQNVRSPTASLCPLLPPWQAPILAVTQTLTSHAADARSSRNSSPFPTP